MQFQFDIKSIGVRIFLLLGVLGMIGSGAFFATRVAAQSNDAKESDQNGRIITIYDRNQEKVVVSKAKTIRDTLQAAGVSVDPSDRVEPSLDEELVASQYQVNIYRARPVVIVDGAHRHKIVSAYQTPTQIAEQAGVKIYPEDVVSVAPSTDIVMDGISLRMDIDRATPFALVLYGKKIDARTHASTVADMLKEKDITLGKNDVLTVKKDAKIAEGMKVEIWRNGTQTVTEEKAVAFPVERIEDANRKVGYREVKTAGVKGMRTVTYEVEMKNGKEVARKEIQSVVTKEPKKQVEVVGTKPDFDGDFAQALAKLRSCEGGYSSWNPAGPYYGAYQFDERTWNSVSSAPYGEATPAEQDAAARALYERRGWQPWPHCGASLPDIYR